MNQSEKETILVKLQELTAIIQGVNCTEETLFNLDGDPTILPDKYRDEKVTRKRITDGTMTASMIARRLTRELGRAITRQSVILVAEHIKAESRYSASQHERRYTPEAADTIMSLYRSFNNRI